MANKVPTEILIKILNNLQSSSKSTRDLYSSLLVNRIWCKVTIPILWELPFGQNCSTKTDTDYKKLNKKALCIRTYISCMDTQVRNLLIQKGFDLSSSPSQATFDYPSFTHKFIINNLVYFISIYSQQIIVSDQDNNNSKDVDKEFVTTVSRILFHEICKLIINRCTFLDYFKLATVPLHSPFYYFNYKDLICSILELPGAPKVFKKLESFTSKIRSDDNLIGSLYESLTLICDNILNMNLYFKSIPQDQLIKLISVQKRLENLSINGDYRLLTNSLFFEAIISKKETLKNLRLKKLNFSYFREKLSLNGQFILLQKLYIKNCYELQESDCLILASSFTQLSSFYYFHPRGYSSYPREFIIEILKTANTNLRNIFLDVYSLITFDTFSAILNYCTKITELTLHNLSPEQVIAIFNNNFNELKRFSFDCGGKGFDANDLLCQISENVPELLETIEICRMDYNDPWIFSADSLRIFFEGWCRKGRRGNKKFRRLCIRLTRRSLYQEFIFSPLTLKTMGYEHFKVIEEYGIGIQFEKEKYVS